MKNIAFLSIILAFLSCRFASKDESYIPTFTVLLSDSITRFTTNRIPEGKPTIIVYFSPDCEHCQAETEDLLTHMNSLRQVQFYFITNDPFDRLKAFQTFYKIVKYPNITLAQDYEFSIQKHYQSPVTPLLLIYDHHKMLRGMFSGEVSANKVIEFVNKM